MKLEIDDTGINAIQHDSIVRAIGQAKSSNYIDIVFRVGGQFVRIEGDWVKHLRIVESDE